MPTSYRGVYPSNKKFACRLFVGGRIRHVGTFSTAEQCAVAYDSAMWYLRKPESGRLPKFNSPEFSIENPPPLVPEVLALRERLSQEISARSAPLGAAHVLRSGDQRTNSEMSSLAGLQASRFALSGFQHAIQSLNNLLSQQALNLAEFTRDPRHRAELALFAGVPETELPVYCSDRNNTPDPTD